MEYPIPKSPKDFLLHLKIQQKGNQKAQQKENKNSPKRIQKGQKNQPQS